MHNALDGPLPANSTENRAYRKSNRRLRLSIFLRLFSLENWQKDGDIFFYCKNRSVRERLGWGFYLTEEGR